MTTSFMMRSEQLCLHACQGAWRTFNVANSVNYNLDHDDLSGVCCVFAVGNQIEEHFVNDVLASFIIWLTIRLLFNVSLKHASRFLKMIFICRLR